MTTDIQAIISQMTLEEKAALCTGASAWTTTPVERLGIPEMIVSDGPHGARRVPNVLVRAGTPEYLLANILIERNSTLRQSLHMLPNYEDTVKMISETLAEI